MPHILRTETQQRIRNGSVSELLHGAKAKPKPEEAAVAEDAEEMTVAQMDGRYAATPLRARRTRA